MSIVDFKISNTPTKSQVFFWNMAGGITNAATTVVLIIAATRIIGANNTGILAIAIATSQMLLSLGNYGVRAYQATDIIPQFSFSDYLANRLLTCFLMLAASWVVIAINHYTGEKAVVLFLMCALKMIDALADVYEGLMHQRNLLNIAGKALCYRTLTYSIVFIVALYLSHSLMTASFFSVIANIIVFLLLNLRPAMIIEKVKIVFNIEKIKAIFIECFPLFASMFMMLFIVNAPKYSIDSYMSSDYQTYYNILYTPAQIINMLSAFVFKPLLTTMADKWISNAKKFINIIYRLLLCILGITLLVEILTYFAGIQLINFIYGIDLSMYRNLLLICLLGGGLNAVNYLLYYTLTAARCHKNIFICYLVTSIMSLPVSILFVKKMALFGAVISYVLLMLVLMLLMVIITIIAVSKRLDQRK